MALEYLISDCPTFKEKKDNTNIPSSFILDAGNADDALWSESTEQWSLTKEGLRSKLPRKFKVTKDVVLAWTTSQFQLTK